MRKIAGGLLCVLCAAVVTARAEETAGLATLDFREIVKKSKDKVFPALVFIKCVRETHAGGKKQSVEVAGSGVLISADGEMLTNWHVMDKATEIRCLLYDGRAFYGELKGSDKDLDIALVRLKLGDQEKNLPHAEIGDSSQLKEGDFVMAMGAPWGLVRSVSIGIVSCARRYLKDQSEYTLWLQTDASISPGNSGGPLVNTDGRIVGINTMGTFFGGDMGFAIPSATIREILPRLGQHGNVEWAWTGLELQAIRDFNRNMYFDYTNGVIVASAAPGSPARRAGIRELDRIVRINRESVTGMTEENLPDIRRKIGLLPLDRPVQLQVARGDTTIDVELTPRNKGKVEGEELDCPRWDLTVKAINQFDNRDLYFQQKEGVFIFGVKYPGNAAKANLAPRDILVDVDGEAVVTLDDVKRLHKRSLENLETKSRVVLKILRNGMMRQIILDFSRDYEKE